MFDPIEFIKQLVIVPKLTINSHKSTCTVVFRPPFYRQPRLSPKFSSVPISPIKNTLLYCQTQLPPSATGFQTQKS